MWLNLLFFFPFLKNINAVFPAAGAFPMHVASGGGDVGRETHGFLFIRNDQSAVGPLHQYAPCESVLTSFQRRPPYF